MRISSKTRIALQTVVKLVRENKVLTSFDVAKELGITEMYPQQILPKLAKAKVIQAIKGPNGGYKALPYTKDVNIGTISKIVELPQKNSSYLISENRLLVDSLLEQKEKLFLSTKVSEVINGTY